MNGRKKKRNSKLPMSMSGRAHENKYRKGMPPLNHNHGRLRWAVKFEKS